MSPAQKDVYSKDLLCLGVNCKEEVGYKSVDEHTRASHVFCNPERIFESCHMTSMHTAPEAPRSPGSSAKQRYLMQGASFWKIPYTTCLHAASFLKILRNFALHSIANFDRDLQGARSSPRGRPELRRPSFEISCELARAGSNASTLESIGLLRLQNFNCVTACKKEKKKKEEKYE